MRALVPWWVLPTAVAAHASAAFVVGFGLGALLFALARRAHDRNAPWPLRARALHPPRVAIAVAHLALPGTALLGMPLFWGPLVGPAGLVAAAAAIGPFLGIGWWRRRLASLLGGARWTLRQASVAAVTRALIRYPALWIALIVAVAMPRRFDAVAAALVVTAGAGFLWVARGGGFRLARAVGLAPPGPPALTEIIGAAATRAGVPLAGVHVVELAEANAFAFTTEKRIGFTRAALGKLDLKSLVAIARHELAHLTEDPRARRMRAASMIVLFPLILARPLAEAFGPEALAVAILLAVVLTKLFQRASRALEARADAGAGDADPAAHAHALTELYRVNLIPAVHAATTHPHLYDRLVALGAPLPYPRPPRPSFVASVGLLALVLVGGVAIAFWGSLAAIALADRPWVSAALDGGTVADVSAAASAAHAELRYDEAAELYGAAAALEPDEPIWPAYQAMSLASAGRLAEAEQAVAEAVRRGAEEDLVVEARGWIERGRGLRGPPAPSR